MRGNQAKYVDVTVVVSLRMFRINYLLALLYVNSYFRQINHMLPCLIMQ